VDQSPFFERMLFSSCVALQMVPGSFWIVSILCTSVFGESKSTILRTKYYQLGSTAAFKLVDSVLRSLLDDWLSWRVCHGFPYSLLTNTRIVPWIRPRPLLSIFLVSNLPTIWCCIMYKQFLYRPGQALKAPGGSGLTEFVDSWHMNVARLSTLCTDCLYPPGDTTGPHISLRGWVYPRPWCSRNDYVDEKYQWPHWKSNSKPSNL
jgi:hypothetical protein